MASSVYNRWFEVLTRPVLSGDWFARLERAALRPRRVAVPRHPCATRFCGSNWGMWGYQVTDPGSWVVVQGEGMPIKGNQVALPSSLPFSRPVLTQHTVCSSTRAISSSASTSSSRGRPTFPPKRPFPPHIPPLSFSPPLPLSFTHPALPPQHRQPSSSSSSDWRMMM
eukprot:2012400-Rhodomonas_salina.1